MDNEKSAVIRIGGQEYELILTTRATKEIAKRYGGLANPSDKLMKSENFEMTLGKVVWLIALFANQSILIHNHQKTQRYFTGCSCRENRPISYIHQLH